MKSILFLDNSLKRCAVVQSMFNGEDLHIAHNVSEAIQSLGSHQFDLVSLDHDLVGNKMTKSDESSGYEVVKFILASKEKPKNVIVHSGNKNGSKKMCDALLDSNIKTYKLPFSLGDVSKFRDLCTSILGK